MPEYTHAVKAVLAVVEERMAFLRVERKRLSAINPMQDAWQAELAVLEPGIAEIEKALECAMHLRCFVRHKEQASLDYAAGFTDAEYFHDSEGQDDFATDELNKAIRCLEKEQPDD